MSGRKIEKEMDTALLTTIVSTGGAVIVGLFGMFFTANQLGRRIDDLRTDSNARMGEINNRMGELRAEFNAFRDLVNLKLSAIDLEIAKLMGTRP